MPLQLLSKVPKIVSLLRYVKLADFSGILHKTFKWPPFLELLYICKHGKKL